jgi:hypothetical protein
VVASWVVFRLKHGGRQCWGVSENPDKIPEHKRRTYANVQVTVADDVRGDKGSPRNCSYPKVMNPLIRALTPPFIGRRRDFRQYPWTQRIFLVWTHTNVFLHLIYLQACH